MPTRLDRVTNGKDGASINFGAQGWLQLLLEMRKVILQDSIELRDCYPSRSIWKHAPFNTAAYKAWAEKARVQSEIAPLNTAESERLNYPASMDLASDMHTMRVATLRAQRDVSVCKLWDQPYFGLTAFRLLK
jgi:hypothetical protein